MSNHKLVSVNVSGLLPGETYSYFFTGKGGNWPSTITAPTGSIVSCCTDSVETIKTAVNFCATTGSCYGDPNLLPYDNAQCGKNVADIYTLLNLRVREDVSGDTVLKKDFSVTCDNCLPNITITTPAKVTLTSSNKYECVSTITGLQKNESYSYRFYPVDGNWPVRLTNVSGIIKPIGTSTSISSDIIFCETTGVCAPSSNVFFTESSCVSPKDLSAKIYLEIVPLSCAGESVRGDQMTVVCNNCLPIATITTIPSITLTSTNAQNINVLINNLRKYKSYNYAIHKVDGNWPVRLSAVTGSFTPNSESFILTSRLTFCETTGICGVSSNNILSASESCLDKNQLFSRLYVSVTPTECDTETVVSNHFSVLCNDCLPKIRVSLPSDVSITNSNTYTVSSTIDGLITGKSYNYEYDSINSNWPTVIEPISGTFIASSGSKQISSKLTFVYPSGDALGVNGLLDYTTNEVNQTYDPYVTMNLLVESNDCEQDTASSRDFTATCDNCLPCLSCASAYFSGYPIMTLATGCCSGTKVMLVNVSGAVPFDNYIYALTGINGNASFSPATGLINFANGGSGVIQTLMTTSLINNQKTIVNVSLTHLDTNITNKSSLAIVCGTGC